MVSTSAPSACGANTVQLFTDAPFMNTVQAPHWLVSQPTWVPVSERFSRSRWTSSTRGSTSTSSRWPLTVSVTRIPPLLLISVLLGFQVLFNVAKELFGQVLGCRWQQALPNGRQRAGDPRIAGVAQQSGAVRRLEREVTLAPYLRVAALGLDGDAREVRLALLQQL